MFFLDIKNKEAEFEFYYFKCDEKSYANIYSYKTTTLKKKDISEGNAIMYRFFYNLSEPKNVFLNEDTIKNLNEIYKKGNHKFNNKNNFTLYTDFYNWCIEESKEDLNIKEKLESFEAYKMKINNSVMMESNEIKCMMQIYNLLYRDYGDKYKTSKLTYRESETKEEIVNVLNVENGITHHLIDTQNILDLNFIKKISKEDTLEDTLCFFDNNYNTIEFSIVRRILEFKNVELIHEEYDINLLISAYLLSFNKNSNHKFKIYTSNSNVDKIKYLTDCSCLNIEIINVDNFLNNDINIYINHSEYEEDIEAIDIDISILDDDEDDI